MRFYARKEKMNIFNVLEFLGGLSLFLFGMSYMGSSLEKKAGGQMSQMLSKFCSNKYTGFLLGLIVTAVIQASGATTVMVVGFVNSGILTLTQSVGVIIGANVGTTITSWILSLTGIEGGNLFVSLLKPSSFTPIVAFIGVILYVFIKDSKKRDIGMILVGFAILMFGMQTASNAVSGLSEVPGFEKLFLRFQNPILGIIAGAVLTAILQSSSASVGVLQALCSTGQVTIGAALPIILGQNIGTCITAMISSVGANKNARRAAMIHFNFNVLGSGIIMILFYGAKAFLKSKFAFVDNTCSAFSIAVIHSLINIITTVVFLPGSSILEKLSCKMVKEKGEDSEELIIDERFFVNPPAAAAQCRMKVCEMAEYAVDAFIKSMTLISEYNEDLAKEIADTEEKLDKYEDVISSYLVKLNAKELSDADSNEVAKLLHVTGAFERLSDHAVHVEYYSRQLRDSNMKFSDAALKEIAVITEAVTEIVTMTKDAFCKDDILLAGNVEPLEQVVDGITAKVKGRHIERTLKGKCTFESGLIFADTLSVLERVSDHCSEIAASIIEIPHGTLDVHAYVQEYKSKENSYFKRKYNEYKAKYSLESRAI